MTGVADAWLLRRELSVHAAHCVILRSVCGLKRRMAETAKLNAKLKAFLEDPKDFLDLSGMDFRADGARIVAEFLPKW